MRRTLFLGPITVLVLLVILCAPSIALADGITWDVSATFSDGATASGSFVYDATTNMVSAINIVTNPGLFGGPTTTYKDLDPGFGALPIDIVFVPDATLADLTGTPFLDLEFATGLTNSGGTVSLVGASFPGNEGLCDAPICDSGTTFRIMLAGSEVVSAPVVSTPEPSALLLLGSGLICLVGTAKRKVFKA